MDLSSIFSNNIIIVYFFLCLSLFMHSEMSENQKMVILYLVSYLACFLKVIPVVYMSIAVLGIQFIYEEFLTVDKMKLKTIVRIDYKICDYIYRFFFMYATWLFLVALALISERVQKKVGTYNQLLVVLSCILILILVNFVISKKFVIKSVNDIYKILEKNPINQMPKDIPEEKFDILVDVEDKSYFFRKNTYNVLSCEFVKYKLRNIGNDNHQKKNILDKVKRAIEYIKRTKNVRGYSTIEMQLLRIIGIEKGYEECKIRRKIFEFLYTIIFLPGLKNFYGSYQYANWWDFKKYLIWVYYHEVRVQVDGEFYDSIASYMNMDVKNWPLELMFVAILSLSGHSIKKSGTTVYESIIQKYDLNTIILEYLSSSEKLNIYDFSVQMKNGGQIEEKKKEVIQKLITKRNNQDEECFISRKGENKLLIKICNPSIEKYDELKKEIQSILSENDENWVIV